jgi:C1A family cysteine protease
MAPPEGVFDGHSVLLVGYADDPQQPGGGIVLIRNSGGGVHDGALTYEYVSAYMNDAAWIELVR